MTLAAGSKLGPYEILSPLGAGGMGEVYRGRDTRLGRAVAVKVLPSSLAEDKDRLRRFEQEARAGGGLDHPNVLAIHDVGTHDGAPYLVFELLEGETLRQRLREGPLSPQKSIEYGMQVASGLAAAHEKGLVHRDLKPENLFVTREGRVKILDFGLAKLRPEADFTQGGSEVATLSALTEAGTVLGTSSYMSPEQAQGLPVDHRSDIFSFGSVLYEMLTGQRAFGGDTPVATMAAILKEEPAELQSSSGRIPPALEHILRRCLEKRPEHRFHSAHDLGLALEAVSGATGARAAPMLSRRWPTVAAAALALAVALGGFAAWRLLRPARATPITALAVLPLKNFSGDPQQDFFVDGMTDALISNLAQIKALKVISRTSVMQYKDAKKPLPAIAKELGVEGIIEGSVMRSGGRVRVTAQLIDARSDQHLWAENYEREMTDVLALQDEVARAIAGEIRVHMTPQERGRLAAARAVDPEVYDATLKGRAAIEYATRESEIRRAIGLFKAAIDKDPTYAPAWAGLGEATWTLAMVFFEFVAPGQVRGEAIAAAERALKLDETLPEAHNARALVAFDGEWDVAKAQRHFERALELRPGYAAAHNLYGQMLIAPLGRFEEARRHYDRARELDPFSPYNDINSVGYWLYQGRPERAIEEGESVHRRNASLFVIPWVIGFAHLSLHQPSQAVSQFESALELLPERPTTVLGPLGLAYGLAGRREDALRVLGELEQAPRQRYVSPVERALVHSGLGQMDEAFQLLEQAFEQRTPMLVYLSLSVDPQNIALRRDPRWKPLIDRIRRVVRLPPGTRDPFSP